ncbi:MAG: RnfH family protein [Pseudomonadota bacterium]
MAEISIEVAYATPALQKVMAIKVAPRCKARDAVAASGLKRYFPELDYTAVSLGVWGRPIDDEYLLQPGDRLELYRPLAEDPRERRRRIALAGETM